MSNKNIVIATSAGAGEREDGRHDRSGGCPDWLNTVISLSIRILVDEPYSVNLK